jgi:hypothetical protein
MLPPLGLITVASFLPKDWELRLKDRNIEDIDETDWQCADLILISGMIAQKPDFLALVRQTKNTAS